MIGTPLVYGQTSGSPLLSAEDQLATALVERDRDTFERLLSDTFVLRGTPDVDRATWMRNALDLCWGDTVDLTDVVVRAESEDTAVVSLVMTTYTDPVTCEPAIISSLLTDLWVRTPEGWRLALRHAGPAGDAVTQQFARAEPPPPRWLREAELSLVSTGGNTDTRTLGVGGALTWRPGRWVTRARTTYVRSTADDTTTAESLNADLRQSRTLSPRLDLRTGAVYLIDRFAGIEHRVTVDGGLGWRAVDASPHTLLLDVAAGVTRETRLGADDLTFPVGTLDAQYRWRLSRTSELVEQALFTTDLGNAANWRLRNVAHLTVSMTRVLSFKVAHELRRTNRPVPGFRATDTTLSAALVATF